MAEFHHHPDGIIYLRAEGETYAGSLDRFAAAVAARGLPAYGGLPDGIRERRYVVGAFHALYTADSQLDGGDWPHGDLYLAACVQLIAADRPPEAA